MIFTINDCSVDTDAYEVRRHGSPVPVEPQVFDLLVLLLENPDRVVTKDEIIARIWHGRIVSEAALSSRIKAVRQAIGDDGGCASLHPDNSRPRLSGGRRGDPKRRALTRRREHGGPSAGRLDEPIPAASGDRTHQDRDGRPLRPQPRLPPSSPSWWARPPPDGTRWRQRPMCRHRSRRRRSGMAGPGIAVLRLQQSVR